MKLKKLLLFFVVLFSIQSNAQTLNPTVSIAAAGTADTFKGGYTFAYPSSGTPWAGPLISFGGFSNQYDCQLNSNYGGNNISFRTRNGDIGIWNTWNELATRGVNTFTGNQTVNGNIAVGGLSAGSDTSPLSKKIAAYNYQLIEAGAIDFLDFNSTRHATSIAFRAKNASNIPEEFMRIVGQDGSVGIGTTTPDEKLTVKGKIHAQEVRVDLQGACAPDYVFQKYYTGKSQLKSDYVMPTLAEIESFTKKNHHLPNVPSAQEVQQKGVSLGEMSNVLLQKVEELTLYAIEQNKYAIEQNKKLMLQQEELERLKKENENYKSLAERLSSIENALKK